MTSERAWSRRLGRSRRLLPAGVALAVVAWAGATACRSAHETVGPVEVDTLAGGRVVVVNHAPPEDAWPRFAGATEIVRLGALDGSGPDVFGQVAGVALGPAVEVYVFDAQAPEIRVFDAEGRHLRSFGREGQGPGELLRPSGFALDTAGLLWVPNTGNGRYTAYDPATGEVVREERRVLGFASFPWPGLVDRSQRLVDVGLDAAGEIAILRLDTSFEPVDTLPRPSGADETQIYFRRDGRVTMSMPDPYAAEPRWTPHPAGGIVVGEGSAYRVHRVGFDRDTTLTIELERARVPVTTAEQDSALAAFEEMAERFASGAVRDRPPRVPPAKPAHGPLFVDDVDRTWVMATTASTDSAVWDVFAPDGRYLGEVRTPQIGFVRPDVRGDRMVVAREVDGVPTVVVYALTRTTTR